MFSDFNLALRNLRKAPGFAFVAVLTLAVGMGSVASIYTALRALVIEPFDYPESEQLVMVWSGDGWPLSPADFLDLHEQMEAFEAFGVYNPQSFNVGEENAIAVSGVTSTWGALRALGVKPALGQWFDEAHDSKGAEPVAVISYNLWQNRFGGDLGIVGKGIRMNGRDVTVLGVMPRGYEFVGPWIRGDDLDVWLPMSLEDNRDTRGSHWLCGIGRLKPGYTAEMADAEIKAIGVKLSELYPNSNFSKKFLVRSLHDEMTREVKDQVWMLFAAVALVLLVACANVASMLLARAAKRSGEFGIRVSLGATKRDLARLALAESAVLALLGGAMGLGIAFGGIEVLKAISPVSEARKAAMAVDGSVVLFVLGTSILTAIIAGLPPILSTMRTSLATVIREDARGSVGSRSRHFMLRALVIGQIAVAFVLANGAALFSASYFKLLDENRVLSTENVLSARVTLQGERYSENEARVRTWEVLTERLAALPGVSSAAITSKLPLNGGSNTNGLVNDEVYDPSQQRIQIERTSVTEDYFETMGLKLLQGRTLLPEDDQTEDGFQGVVVNEEMVRKAWPDKNPIGEIIRANQEGDPWYTATVVGVVEDVKQWGASAPQQAEMYTRPKGHWGNRIHIVLRSRQNAIGLEPMLREAVQQVDSELAIEQVRTLQQVVLDATQTERAIAGLVNFFMATALGLVAVGLYGTLSYHILQRTREIGVRRAIGALRSDVTKLVIRQGALWVVIGLAIGVVGIFALSLVLKNIVYGMEGITAQPLLVSAAVIGLAGMIACWIPANRASRLDPLEALRSD